MLVETYFFQNMSVYLQTLKDPSIKKHFFSSIELVDTRVSLDHLVHKACMTVVRGQCPECVAAALYIVYHCYCCLWLEGGAERARSGVKSLTGHQLQPLQPPLQLTEVAGTGGDSQLSQHQDLGVRGSGSNRMGHLQSLHLGSRLQK